MKPIILESPFAGDFRINILYARLCMHDCLVNHGEAPYASHLLYTQPNVLDDTVPEEREKGIHAGFVWRDLSEKTVVYTDLGISRGMQYGIDHANETGHSVEYRTLPKDLKETFDDRVELFSAFPNQGSDWT